MNLKYSYINILKSQRYSTQVYHSGERIEKKSRFVAHCAKIYSEKEKEIALELILSDKKNRKATHNIQAYRYQVNGIITQGSDCDGETGAGKKLLMLLQQLDVNNALVVVTRWYGHTKLGPSRFRIINETAIEALLSAGFIRK
jgi:putative IMPACT (imprinted ancient) family translation regulator